MIIVPTLDLLPQLDCKYLKVKEVHPDASHSAWNRIGVQQMFFGYISESLVNLLKITKLNDNHDWLIEINNL